MTIISIETAITIKCSFVTKTDIPKEMYSVSMHCSSTKLNSQFTIILTQFLYQVDSKDGIVWIDSMRDSRDFYFTFYLL